MIARPVKWIGLSLGVLALSVVAIWVRAASYPEQVPRYVARALDWFVEPGAAVWWLTTGKAFQAFPSDFPGYVVVAVVNTVVWAAVGAIVMTVGRGAVRAARRDRL